SSIQYKHITPFRYYPHFGQSINIGRLPVGNRALVVLRNGTRLVRRDDHLLSEVLEVLAAQTEEVHLSRFSSEVAIDMNGEVRERVELGRLQGVVDAARGVRLQVDLLLRLQTRHIVEAHSLAVLEQPNPRGTLLAVLSDQAEPEDADVALEGQIDQQLLVAIRLEETSTIHFIVPFLEEVRPGVGRGLIEDRYLQQIDRSPHVIPYSLDDGIGRQFLRRVGAATSVATMTVIAHS
ncbi:hypothetical protein PENTCL1PPCAC_13710, partial [Pristionchus entomophagus]